MCQLDSALGKARKGNRKIESGDGKWKVGKVESGKGKVDGGEIGSTGREKSKKAGI